MIESHLLSRIGGRVLCGVCVPLLFGVVPTGCSGDYTIRVDLAEKRPRFIMHAPTWGRPFRGPKVSAFAIASNEDGELWELRSTDPGGEPARRLTFVYGEVPPGFFQVFPADDARPKPLRPGRTYFVGATGPASTFRAVFALPVGRSGPPTDAGLLPTLPPRPAG
ncbi:MAG: hypothetical protein ACE5E1_05065 [Phycisphaerae bacterium]